MLVVEPGDEPEAHREEDDYGGDGGQALQQLALHRGEFVVWYQPVKDSGAKLN